MQKNYSKEKQVAMQAIKKASAVLLKYFKKIDSMKVIKKDKHEIVTPADFKSDEIIKSHISKYFPSHGFLSEETGQDRLNPEFLWVIDPLDGTTNFSIGNHFFDISIALVHKKEIVVGVVLAPFFKQLFAAEKGKGAFLNGKKINVSKKNNPIDSKINFGYASQPQRNQQIAKIHSSLLNKFEYAHNLGAAALELAWVSMGRLEAYILPHTKPWDIAAGVLLVREAGGKVTDFSGREYKFTTNIKETLLASNSKVHESVLRIVRE